MKKEDGDNNYFGLASVILGIVALSTSLLSFIPAIILGIVALVFGMMQRKRANNKWAFYGIILSIVAIVLNVILLVALLWAITNYPEIAGGLA